MFGAWLSACTLFDKCPPLRAGWSIRTLPRCFLSGRWEQQPRSKGPRVAEAADERGLEVIAGRSLPPSHPGSCFVQGQGTETLKWSIESAVASGDFGGAICLSLLWD